MNTAETVAKLRELVEKLRPYLQEDGGDLEFVRFDAENRDVYVRMSGSCGTCPMAINTLRAGIERFILMEMPDIHRVENVR